jgi:hypothetical protein
LHEDWQSVDDDEVVVVPPSSVDELVEDDDVQLALHPDSQRESQSVVQSSAGGFDEQLVEHEDWQLETQLVSADAVHCELHCCSSLAAHASSQLDGAHCVVQFSCVTSVHCAPASMAMSPHADDVETAARAVLGANAASATARTERRAQRVDEVFMVFRKCKPRATRGPIHPSLLLSLLLSRAEFAPQSTDSPVARLRSKRTSRRE